ncbi:MAG: DNA-binding transcriptional regulator GbsR, MarR family [Candidatus Methanohalarchaeum thermophilum]|uniref:DNA-binding transcriptional regulator GbsR, MarR family n=1 Tax=Methanohalarchaeum thermophilum TaxID=1903181 RepID=A0A1Q6DX21_METT1|nr:MAG: DNA-binding transcriptional regulator GbsR, MarR family [Candidatus Methanohalarchaeum thermophilum]
MKGDKKYETARQNFIRAFTEAIDNVYDDPLFGRIMGILVFENKPLSVAELAEETGYSKSHINNIIRKLKTDDLIKAKRKPGSKKNYYELENINEWMLTEAEKIKKSSKQIIEATKYSINDINDKEKTQYLKKVLETHKMVHKSMELLQKLEREELERLLQKYNI